MNANCPKWWLIPDPLLQSKAVKAARQVNTAKAFSDVVGEKLKLQSLLSRSRKPRQGQCFSKKTECKVVG